MSKQDDELPELIHKKFKDLENSLNDLQENLKPFLKIPITDVRDQIDDPLKNAKLDLMVAYTTNSLFWAFLATQGIDPKTHPIKDELTRIKSYMGKIQEVEEKKKMSRVDTSAAKRFIRNALWKPNDDDSPHASKGEGTSNVDNTTSGGVVEEDQQQQQTSKQKKRKKQEDQSKKRKKKKKK